MIRYKKDVMFRSKTLRGEWVGLEEIDDEVRLFDHADDQLSMRRALTHIPRIVLSTEAVVRLSRVSTLREVVRSAT